MDAVDVILPPSCSPHRDRASRELLAAAARARAAGRYAENAGVHVAAAGVSTHMAGESGGRMSVVCAVLIACPGAHCRGCRHALGGCGVRAGSEGPAYGSKGCVAGCALHLPQNSVEVVAAPQRTLRPSACPYRPNITFTLRARCHDMPLSWLQWIRRWRRRTGATLACSCPRWRRRSPGVRAGRATRSWKLEQEPPVHRRYRGCCPALIRGAGWLGWPAAPRRGGRQLVTAAGRGGATCWLVPSHASSRCRARASWVGWRRSRAGRGCSVSVTRRWSGWTRPGQSGGHRCWARCVSGPRRPSRH